MEVDVAVFDRDGRIVRDLRRDEFEVFERGTRQSINTVYLVDDAGLPRLSPASRSDAPAAPLPGPEPGVPVRPLPPRVFVFVLDSAHLSPGGLDRTKAALTSFLADGLRPIDLAGVVSGGVMLGNRIISDKAALVDLVRGIRLPASNRFAEMRQWPRILSEEEAALIARQVVAAREQAVQRACDERPGDCNGNGRVAVEAEVEAKSSLLAGESARDGQAALSSLQALANGLGRFPGTKHVIFFSEGFYTGEFAERVTQVAGLASQHRVRVSTIDARGLATDARQQSLFDAAPLANAQDLGALNADLNADVLTTLAFETGGERIRNRNNLRPGLDLVAQGAGTHYVVGYSPDKPFDDTYRAIEVKVTRQGARVVARRGYLAVRATEAAAAPAASVSAAPGPPATTGIGAAAPSAPPGAGAPSAAPPVVVPPSTGIAAPGAAGTPPGAAGATAAPGGGGTPGPAGPPVAAAPGPPPGLRLRPSGLEGASAEVRGRLEALTDAERVGAMARAGWDLYAAGRVEEARDALAEASRRGGGVWVDYALGMAEFTLGRLDEAAAVWQGVLSRVPEYRSIYFDLADVYLQQSRSQDALRILREAARRFPDDAEAHNAVGVVLTRRGAVDDAIESFQRAVKAAPAEGLGFFNLARAYHLRYIRRLQTLGLMTSAVREVTDRDRRAAIDAYTKALSLGGDFESDARAALDALGWK